MFNLNGITSSPFPDHVLLTISSNTMGTSERNENNQYRHVCKMLSLTRARIIKIIVVVIIFISGFKTFIKTAKISLKGN